jgi:multiple sugar transport system substrate-binding protein
VIVPRPWLCGMLAAAVVVLAACGGGSDRGRTKLRFWCLGREGEVVQPLIADFERENPGITVDVQSIPWTAAHEKMLTAYVGGQVPDLAQLGNTWVPEFKEIKAIEALDAYVAASTVIDRADYFPGIWDTNVVGGKLYGLPWYVDTRLPFYRADIYAAAGAAEFPRTWSAWRDTLRRIRTRIPAAAWPMILPTDEWAQPVILFQQLGAQMLDDRGCRARFTGNPLVRQAAEFYLELFAERLAPAASNAQLANVYKQVGTGDIATWVTGPWNIGQFRERLAPAVLDQVRTAPWPAPDGRPYPGVSLAGGASLVIFGSSHHKAEAFRLAEFFARPESQRRFYEASGDLPPRESAWRLELRAGARPLKAIATDREAAAFREQLRHVIPTPKIPEWEQIAQLVQERLETAIRGTATLDEALAGLNGDVDQALAKRRRLVGCE